MEGVDGLHGNVELRFELIHETFDFGGPAGNIDVLDVLGRRGLPEEIESLLDFQHEDFGHRPQVGKFLVLRHVGNLKPLLQLFRILEAQVEFLLQRVGVLVPTHGDVAGEQRIAPPPDHDVHDAGADVEQRGHLIGRHFIVHLESVVNREPIVVDDRGNLAGLAQHVGVIQNLFALHRHQHDVRSVPRRRRAQATGSSG